MSQKEVAELPQRLISTGAFVHMTDDTLGLSDEFTKTRAAIKRSIDAEVTAVLPPELAELELPTRVLADAGALLEFEPSLGVEAAVTTAWSLPMFDQSVPTAGVPEGFIPIRYEEIRPFVEQFPATALYFWREDCDPCDLVRDDLEVLVDEGGFPEWMGRAAMYGTDCAAELSAEFDVGGAPTLLFWVGDSIDCRFVGTKARETLAREIQTVAEQAEKRR
jgi:thiol-disulfide isomerase/thioredoxin